MSPSSAVNLELSESALRSWLLRDHPPHLLHRGCDGSGDALTVTSALLRPGVCHDCKHVRACFHLQKGKKKATSMEFNVYCLRDLLHGVIVRAAFGLFVLPLADVIDTDVQENKRR